MQAQSRFRRAFHTPAQRARYAEWARAINTSRAERALRHALSTVPTEIRPHAFDSYTCPECDRPPVGGWKWWTDPDSWDERLNLRLRCAERHQWSISTDMG